MRHQESVGPRQEEGIGHLRPCGAVRWPMGAPNIGHEGLGVLHGSRWDTPLVAHQRIQPAPAWQTSEAQHLNYY